MARAFILEDFDVSPAAVSVSAQPAATAPSESDMEGARLQGYEAGYKAGWDDASQALSDEQDRISSEFARHLQELSFTYHEAHTALQGELSDLVRGLIEKVLAPMSHATLGELLHARIAEIAADSKVPIEILVAPDNVARLERLVAQAHGPPLRLIAEPSLGAGQAFLRFGQSEEQIDLDTVMSELAAAVERYFGAQNDPDAGGEGASSAQETHIA